VRGDYTFSLKVGQIFSSELVKNPPILKEEDPLLTIRKKPNPVKSGPVKYTSIVKE